MQLRCQLCDRRVDIPDDSLLGKRARQIPGFVFICEECRARHVERYGRRQERPNPALPSRHRRHRRRPGR